MTDIQKLEQIKKQTGLSYSALCRRMLPHIKNHKERIYAIRNGKRPFPQNWELLIKNAIK